MASKSFIRRRVARTAGDLVVVRATEPSAANTLIDVYNLRSAENDTTLLVGSQGIITKSPQDPTLLWHTFRVLANHRDEASLDFEPPLPAGVPMDTVAELVNLRGEGWTLDEYDDAIETAFETVRRDTYIESSELVGTYDSSTGIVVPTTLRGVYGINYWTPDGYWRDLMPDQWSSGPGRTLRVSGGGWFDQHLIRLDGYLNPTYPDDEVTDIPVDVEYLIAEATYWLAQMRMPTAAESDIIMRMIDNARQRAEAKRPMVMGDYRANTVFFD